MQSTVNKAKGGYFKDETHGQIVEETILPRPKMYSMKYKDIPRSTKPAKKQKEDEEVENTPEAENESEWAFLTSPS